MSSDKKVKTIVQVKKEIAQLLIDIENESDKKKKVAIEREIEKLRDFLIFIRG